MTDVGTAITCIDGRIQAPVAVWLKREHALDYVDIISEPGADREVALGWMKVLDLKAKAALSANAHASRVIAVVGHHDCAANPVSVEEHQRLITRAVEVIHGWRLFATTLGLWVNARWEVELVDARVDPPSR
jgi:hypothetical protein